MQKSRYTQQYLYYYIILRIIIIPYNIPVYGIYGIHGILYNIFVKQETSYHEPFKNSFTYSTEIENISSKYDLNLITFYYHRMMLVRA